MKDSSLVSSRLALLLVSSLVATMALPTSGSAQGTIYAWGGEWHWGGPPYQNSGALVDTPTISEFTQVAAGKSFSLGLRADGALQLWGDDRLGQISSAPTGVGFLSIAAGDHHGLALRGDGSIVAWGSDTDGQVSSTPIGAGFVQIAAKRDVSFALHADGSIAAWGDDTYGQVTLVPPGNDFVQVSPGWIASLALRTDGSLVAWGTPVGGVQLQLPTETGFTRIAGGDADAFATRADGTIKAWGGGHAAQFMPWGLSDLEDIVVANQTAVGIDHEGKLTVWGDPGTIYYEPPAGGDFMAISACYNRVLAIRRNSEGTAFCFGDGTGPTCPCGLNGIPGSGCDNQHRVGGARLIGFGNASVAADSFGLQMNGLWGGWGYILRGDQLVNLGSGVPLGDGILCVGGTVARNGVAHLNNVGILSQAIPAGSILGVDSTSLGASVFYQYMYQDSSSSCTGSNFNFSNALQVVWTP